MQMNSAIRMSLAVLLAIGGPLGASSVLAAPPRTVPGPAAGVPDDRAAACDGVQQDRAACLREAGAARVEARRGTLTSESAAIYQQNALARCSVQPPAERAACEARVTGTGNTTVEGSVLGGGLIRETVTPLPPVPAAPSNTR